MGGGGGGGLKFGGMKYVWRPPYFYETLPSYNVPSTLFGGVAKVVKGARVSTVDN